MKRTLWLTCAILTACDVTEPDDVRGTSAGEASVPDPLTDTSTNDYTCADGPAFPGAWAGTIDPAQRTDQPYDFDAGIADALAAADNSSRLPVDIIDAVVANFTTRSGSVDTLWIADEAGGMMSYGVDFNLEADAIAPGDRISFTITDATVYFGLPEITEVEGVVVTPGDGAVYVVDGNAEVITTETHLSQNIQAYGELIADEGACGSSSCFTFGYGDNAHTIRVSEGLGFKVGDCVEIAMPLGIYFEEEQYSIDNNNWVSVF
jgi:hypothetical protein